MPKDSSSVRLSRLLNLIKDFITKESINREDLYLKHGYTSKKTLQRDLNFLRYELDVQIVYDRRSRTYRLADCGPGFMVKSPLSEGEALVLLVGTKLAGHFLPFLSETTQELTSKLKKLMSEDSRFRADTLSEAIIVANPVSKVDGSIFKKVVDAIYAKKVIKTQYRSPYELPEPQERVHHISPWFLYFKHKAWYVWGKSDQYDKSGSFRISRFRYAQIRDDMKYEEPPENIRIEDLIHSENPFCDDAYNLKLKIKEPFATSVKDMLNLYPQQKITKEQDGTVVFSAKVRNLEEVSRWVLSSADCVEILEPQELKEIVKRKATTILKTLVSRGEQKCIEG